MFALGIKRTIIATALTVGFMFGVLYVASKYYPFIVSMLVFDKFNLATAPYLLMRLLTVLLSLVLLLPINIRGRFSKINILRGMLIAIGVCYLIGLVGDNVCYGILSGYDDKGYDPIFVKMTFDTIAPVGYILCGIQGVLYILAGIFVKKRRWQFTTLFVLIFLMSFVPTIIYNTRIVGIIPTSTWQQKNTLLLFELGFITLSILIASTDRMLWGNCLYSR